MHRTSAISFCNSILLSSGICPNLDLAKFKALLLDKNFEKENPIKFYEITDKTCRWPIGHPHEKDFYFCGRTPMEKFQYCQLHVLYAFSAKNEKEEDKITEEDIPIFIEKKIKSA